MRRLSLIVIGGLLAAGFMVPADAAPWGDSSNINSQVEAAGDAVDQANSKVTKALAAYKKASAGLPAAKSALRKAEAALAVAKAADTKAQTDLSNSEAAMNRAYNALKLTRSNLSAEKTQVGQLIRTLYRQGPLSELSIIMGADTPADFTSRVAALDTWHANKSATINKLTKAREDLTQKTAQLNALVAAHARKKASAAKMVASAKQAAANAKAAKAAVDKIVAQKQSALNEAKKYQSATKKRYNQLKAEQERLRQLAAGAGSLGKNLNFKGSMSKPIPGARITSLAGFRIHPIFHYRRCHAGIDFGAKYGTPIKAAADGVVASTAYMSGYGKATLIAHGKGVTSFYAHQSRQVVKKGQTVKKGQLIGYVGSTGWSTGPHLHFEVRVNGVAYNPLGWLGGGTKSKVCG
ncbi:MAG: hypothetical protein RL410_1496 [Actinomycetota bacterium]